MQLRKVGSNRTANRFVIGARARNFLIVASVVALLAVWLLQFHIVTIVSTSSLSLFPSSSYEATMTKTTTTTEQEEASVVAKTAGGGSSSSSSSSPPPPPCRAGSVRSVQDIRRCYPAQLVRKLGPSCEEVNDWDTVQRCLSGRFVNRFIPGSQIHIIGERNSGTKFLMREVQRCFTKPATPIAAVEAAAVKSNNGNSNNNNATTSAIGKIHRDFLRSKHFFQPVVRGDYTRSYVLAVFRDPVEWVAAMREHPYHSPNHLAGFSVASRRRTKKTNRAAVAATGIETEAMPLSWTEFVSRPWSTNRSNFDLQLMSDPGLWRDFFQVKKNKCRWRFPFQQVVPCRYDNASGSVVVVPPDQIRGYEPIYELRRDNSGRPFRNLLELRSEKIVNFLLEMPMILNLGGYVPVRYEDMLRYGTKFVLEQVAAMIGMEGGRLPDHCHPTEPQPERLGRRMISPKMREWVLQHADASTERLLGYR